MLRAGSIGTARGARALPLASAYAALAAAVSMCALMFPARGVAAVSTFGSPLSVPATLNTAVNLGYSGTDTQVLPSPEAPTGVYHTYHFGTDGAFWNQALAQ